MSMHFTFREENYVIIENGSWRLKARIGVRERDTNTPEAPTVVSTIKPSSLLIFPVCVSLPEPRFSKRRGFNTALLLLFVSPRVFFSCNKASSNETAWS